MTQHAIGDERREPGRQPPRGGGGPRTTQEHREAGRRDRQRHRGFFRQRRAQEEQRRDGERSGAVAHHPPHRRERETGGEQVEARRDPDHRFVIRGVQREEERGHRPGDRPRRERAADEEDEHRAQSVQQDVGEVELPGIGAGEAPVDRVRDEPERTVVLEELAAEEPEDVRRTGQRPEPVDDHEVVADEARSERGPVDGDGGGRHDRRRGPRLHAGGFRHATW